MDWAGVSINNMALSLWTTRGKLGITSLNSHFAGIYFGTRYMVLSAWRGAWVFEIGDSFFAL